jgi:hypothetical protein
MRSDVITGPYLLEQKVIISDIALYLGHREGISETANYGGKQLMISGAGLSGEMEFRFHFL